MSSSAQQQQTFTLLLKAQDDASAAIRSVGQQLERLGEGTSLAGLSAQLSQLGERLEAVGPRASAAAGAVEKVGHAAEGARGPLERFGEFAKNMVIWNVGAAAVGKVTEGIGAFASGLVSTNSALEQSNQTFTAVYGSAAKGQQAVAWLTDFAAKVPATRQEVISAGLALASMGDNIGEVMPALSNVAAVMGVSLPMAAQALNDAMTGDTQMLRQDLHISIADLQKFGAQVEANGHIVEGTLLPAFEKLSAARFGQGAALQMETLGGKMSNVADAFTKLQEIMGKGVFGALKGELDGVIRLLGSADAQRWAMGIGDALGHALQGLMDFAGWMAHNFGPPIMATINVIVVAWKAMAPAVEGAVRLIEGLLGGIGTFLQSAVLPVVQNATGQIVGWWTDHVPTMSKVFDDLGAAAQRLWDWLATSAKNAMLELEGVWTIAWGVVSGVVGVAIDVISGDWKKGKDDLIGIWKAIQVGVLEIVNAMIDQVIHAFHLLAGPIAQALNAILPPAFKGVVALAVEMFTAMSLKIQDIFGGMIDSVVQKILSIPDKINKFSNKLGEQVRKTLGLQAGGGGGGGGSSGFGGPTRDEDIWAQAQAAGAGASAFLGSVLPQTIIPTVTFDETQVTAGVDKWFSDLEKKISPKLTTGATQAGKTWWETFVAALHTQGITLPPLGPQGPVPPPPAGTGFGGGGAGSADSAKAATDAYTTAKDAFELLLAKGPVTYTAGMTDIAQIATTAHAAGQSDAQVQLEVLRDTNQLIDKLLATADKQFTFDSSVAHPSIKKLHEDEKNYLAILAHTPGIKPADLTAARQQYEGRIGQVLQAQVGKDQQRLQDMETLHYGHAALVKQVDQIMRDYAATGERPGSLHYRALHQQLLEQISGGTGKTPEVPTPLQHYGGLAAGYGGVAVAFGGPQQTWPQQIIAELRAQLRYYQHMVSVLQAQLGVNQQTAQNTAYIAQHFDTWTGHPKTAAASTTRSAASAVRSGGGMQVVKPI